MPAGATIDDKIVNELHDVIGELGGEAIFRHPLKTDEDLGEAIRDGFPPEVVDHLRSATELTLQEHAATLNLRPAACNTGNKVGGWRVINQIVFTVSHESSLGPSII